MKKSKIFWFMLFFFNRIVYSWLAGYGLVMLGFILNKPEIMAVGVLLSLIIYEKWKL